MLVFPTLMLTITYPISYKAALFWSNYITTVCAGRFFAILKTYLKFDFAAEYESKKDLPEQFIIVSNHQSLIDIVVYLVFFAGKEVRFVAKDNLSTVPMVGKMLKCQGHCMIPRRGKPSEAMKTLHKFGERVNANSKILPLIFPEGTRSKDGEIKQFYAAGFRMIAQTVKMPVAVCALDGGWKLSNLKLILSSLKKGTYRVKVLKVFDAPENRDDEKQILADAHDLIEAQLKAWREEK